MHHSPISGALYSQASTYWNGLTVYAISFSVADQESKTRRGRAIIIFWLEFYIKNTAKERGSSLSPLNP